MAQAAMVGQTIGTGIKYYGDVQQYEAEFYAAQEQAASRDRSAQEINDRQLTQAQLLRQQGRGIQSEQQVALSANSIDVSQSNIATLLETTRNVEEEILLRQRQSDFDAESLRISARRIRESAITQRRAAKIAAVGGLIGGAAKTFGDRSLTQGDSAISGSGQGYGGSRYEGSPYDRLQKLQQDGNSSQSSFRQNSNPSTRTIR